MARRARSSGGRRAGERLLAERDHLREPILRLRQGQQRDVHRVVAVEIRIENQVRRIAGVRDHAAQVGDQMRVAVVRRRGDEARHSSAEILDDEMLALALRESLGRELQAEAVLRSAPLRAR